MIRIENLTLKYGKQIAVENLDLTVQEGEALVLLGQSGCGKTSTMRCVAGLEVPSEGHISLGDRVVFDSASKINVPPHKRNVGMVFQSYAVWPHRTVFENVSFPLRMKGESREAIDRDVRQALDTVGLSAFTERGASQLSGGQMQRVALARSLAMRPSVLLLDEPLSNLDARLRERLRVELREIQLNYGLTWIYVTHDQQEALSLADRVAVMSGGLIVQLDAPQTLYERPNSLSVARFLGINNSFPARFVGGPGGARGLELSGGQLALERVEVAQGITRPVVCVRSENVLINAPSDHDLACRWQGKVSVVNFQGATIQYQIRVAPDVTLDVVRPSSETPRLRIGDTAEISVAPKNVLVFQDEDPGK